LFALGSHAHPRFTTITILLLAHCALMTTEWAARWRRPSGRIGASRPAADGFIYRHGPTFIAQEMIIMRLTLVSAVLAIALSGYSADASAAGDAQELAELKAQIQALLARVEELEARNDAQTEVNLDIATQLADQVNTAPRMESKGGIKITTPDQQFSATVGGRIHADVYAFDHDLASAVGGSEFRRARLTLAGLALGWDYKLEQDFAAGSNLDGLRDAYIGRQFGLNKLTIGHFKPHRSMEELTSSNDILLLERPFASATGLFSGRQFQQGIGLTRSNNLSYSAGFNVFNTRAAPGARNEGLGWAGRVTWAPIASGTQTLHLGAWASVENANLGSPSMTAVANYAGRRGPTQTIATTTGASGKSVNAFGLEFAGRQRGLFLQGEYARADFQQLTGSAHQVETYYLQGSVMLNGGMKLYRPGTGVFAGPNMILPPLMAGGPPVYVRGLWELTGRYDHIENKDIDQREASTYTLGLNYYINANLRLMANYSVGDNEVNGDQTKQLALRTQFGF